MFKKEKDFNQVYLTGGDETVFCYRSGLLVYEEVFKNNMLVTGGFNSAGYPLDVLNGYPSRIDTSSFFEPSVFNVELDGRNIDYDLSYADFKSEEKDGVLRCELTLKSSIKPVNIKVHTVLDGTDMLTRYLEIENLSDKPLALSGLSIFSACLEDFDTEHFTLKTPFDKMFRAGYMQSDNYAREGEFVWRDIPEGKHTLDFCFGRDRHRHPLLFINNKLKGTIFFSQIGWSAGCSYVYDYYPQPERQHAAMSLKAKITSYTPITVIKPFETITTPEFYFGLITGGLDDAVNEMHSHIRRSVLTTRPGGSVCEVIGAIGPESDMTVETTKTFMRRFAELGAEIFTIDAGWYAPLENPVRWGENCGIYVPDKDRYPNGFKEIVDYCHSLGMKLALWIDIENAGEKSGLREAHPDWFITDREGKTVGSLLDLSKPEVFDWAKKTIAGVLKEYKIDMLRVDNNNYPNKGDFSVRDCGTGIRECTSFRRYNEIYRLYRELRAELPGVIFENCASGGGRTDLMMLKNFDHTWVSDCQRPPHSFMITNGMTIALPPERVDRLFAGMGCHEWGSLDAHMRNTMLGHMTLNATAPATADDNPVAVDFVKRSVAIYKNFIRPFLPTSKIYHHTAGSAGDPDSKVSIVELASQDRTRAAITVITLSAAEAERYTVYPRGIDVSFDYKVTFDNYGESYIVKGCDLRQNGIAATVPASLSSELILIERI